MQDQDLTSSPQPDEQPRQHMTHPAMHFAVNGFGTELDSQKGSTLNEYNPAKPFDGSVAAVDESHKHESSATPPFPEQPVRHFEPQPAVVSPEARAEPPQPPSEADPPVVLPANGVTPVPVIQVLSTRGVEYLMFTIMLWVGAIDLGWILLALINGGANFDILSFPVASLLVVLPIFGYLLVRLKRAEFANPGLRLEPSKRRLTQITQVVTFLVCFVNLVAFVYLIMVKISGQFDFPLWKMILDLLVIVGIAGGILAYYWFDEHKSRQ